MSESGKLPDITALMARRLRCSGCMRRFRTQDFGILESSTRYGVFRLRCPMCNAQRVVVAVWTRNSVRTYLSDLDAQEWMHYRNAPAVSTDDVIRMARVMSAYDSDFSDVLEDPLFEEKKADSKN